MKEMTGGMDTADEQADQPLFQINFNHQNIQRTKLLLEGVANRMLQAQYDTFYKRYTDCYGDREPLAIYWNDLSAVALELCRDRGIETEEQWARNPMSNYLRRMMYLAVRTARANIQKLYCTRREMKAYEVTDASAFAPEDIALLRLYYVSPHQPSWTNLLEAARLALML